MKHKSLLHTLDARAKLIALLLVLAICVSTHATHYLLFICYALLAALALLDAQTGARILARRAAVAAPMLIAIALFIPFLPEDRTAGAYNLGVWAAAQPASGWLVLWNICVKSALGIAFTCAYAEATPFADTIAALNALRCPRIIALSLAFMHRYLTVLTEEVARMRRAALARGYAGRWFWHAGALGYLAGALFLRGYERGERVYLAMCARGFQGAMPAPQRPMRACDYRFLTAVTLFMFTVRLGGA